MKLILKIAAGIVLAVILLAVGCSALIASGTEDKDFPTADDTSLTSDVSDDDSSDATTSQEQARRSAISYLNSQSFSRKGLIQQLEFEGYSTADATYAADAVNADWNAQAAKHAKSYLQSQSFSRSGLIQQLEFDGFTPAQAEYGVSQTGL